MVVKIFFCCSLPFCKYRKELQRIVTFCVATHKIHFSITISNMEICGLRVKRFVNKNRVLGYIPPFRVSLCVQLSSAGSTPNLRQEQDILHQLHCQKSKKLFSKSKEMLSHISLSGCKPDCVLSQIKGCWRYTAPLGHVTWIWSKGFDHVRSQLFYKGLIKLSYYVPSGGNYNGDILYIKIVYVFLHDIQFHLLFVLNTIYTMLR